LEAGSVIPTGIIDAGYTNAGRARYSWI